MTQPPVTSEGREMAGQDRIEALADRILQASGSALRHYSLHGTREAILEATRGAYMAGWTDGYREARTPSTKDIPNDRT